MSDRKNTGTTSWDAEQVRRETKQKPAEKKERKKKKATDDKNAAAAPVIYDAVPDEPPADEAPPMPYSSYSLYGWEDT